jgi:hypothetical protein
MRVGGVLATAVAILAGCGIVQPGLPDWVVNRQPLEACADGVVVADGPEARSAKACMLEAFRSGRGAELVTGGQMESGEPLVSYLRVHENGTVEMFLNLGDDPSAPGAWERFRCEELVADPVLIFVQEGCEQLPVP